MHVWREGGRLTVRDQPAGHWFLGLFLLAGGLLAIAAPLGLATNVAEVRAWELVASAGVGLGVVAGALWWLFRSPSTRVTLDLTRRQARVTRLGLNGRKVLEFRLADVADFALERDRDSEGDEVTRPVAHLKDGTSVPLSLLWSHDSDGVARVIEAMARACGLPAPSR